MITPQQAREVAKDYLRENRPHVQFDGLLEDRKDYMVKMRARQFPLGPAWIFISKRTGEVRVEAFGDVFEKVHRMTNVTL